MSSKPQDAIAALDAWIIDQDHRDPDFIDFETNGKASEPLVEAEIEGEPLDMDFTA